MPRKKIDPEKVLKLVDEVISQQFNQKETEEADEERLEEEEETKNAFGGTQPDDDIVACASESELDHIEDKPVKEPLNPPKRRGRKPKARGRRGKQV